MIHAEILIPMTVRPRLILAVVAAAHRITKSFTTWGRSEEPFNGSYHTQSAKQVHNGKNGRCHLCDHGVMGQMYEKTAMNETIMVGQ